MPESFKAKSPEELEDEMLLAFVDKSHSEADAEAATDPENPVISNRANIKAEIRIGMEYAKNTRHRDAARESLQATLEAALQNDSTQDLAEEIRGLLSTL